MAQIRFGDNEGNEVLINQQIQARVTGQNLIFNIRNNINQKDSTAYSLMRLADNEGIIIDQQIKVKVQEQNLIFYTQNSQEDSIPYSEEQYKEYYKAKMLGFKGTIAEYLFARDYT